MTRKLPMTAAIVAIALTAPIGRGTAEAHNGGTEAVFMAETFMAAIFAAAIFTIGIFVESGNFAVADSGSVISSVVTAVSA
jgi:hypothetical protein